LVPIKSTLFFVPCVDIIFEIFTEFKVMLDDPVYNIPDELLPVLLCLTGIMGVNILFPTSIPLLSILVILILSPVILSPADINNPILPYMWCPILSPPPT